MSSFKSGDRIIWTYRHSLNSKSKTYITKHGRYLGKRHHTYRFKGDCQMAWVHFDGNKHKSCVPLYQLEIELEGGKE